MISLSLIEQRIKEHAEEAQRMLDLDERIVEVQRTYVYRAIERARRMQREVREQMRTR